MSMRDELVFEGPRVGSATIVEDRTAWLCQAQTGELVDGRFAFVYCPRQQWYLVGWRSLGSRWKRSSLHVCREHGEAFALRHGLAAEAAWPPEPMPAPFEAPIPPPHAAPPERQPDAPAEPPILEPERDLDAPYSRVREASR